MASTGSNGAAAGARGVLAMRQAGQPRTNEVIKIISRRDFLAGTGLAIIAGMAPVDFLRTEQLSPYYPPSLTGLRGSH
ncbi:twin-arginine translocation signal domain-containing protein [Bradyrhizobium sp. Ai1a-2]|uniref:twin-arginine translocation signal domain-containing protein n=1 Tax=Bradyrhizobium sp. Ai1a-2 TaxID=196490 RepID=UPI00126871CB|nr:twin-arginine translocation signal domain-containing protein [Bradyrhizobium sp. Ai1a-2]